MRAAPLILVRSIGLTQATAMVVGIIIGASIFVQPSEVSRAAPSLGAMLLVWMSAGALTWFGASICAELSSAFPETGGVYVFLSRMFSPAVGFLWGWAMFWSMHSGIIAAIAVVFARYASGGADIGDPGVKAIAVAGILVMSVINYCGVRPGAGVQTALTIAKVGAIVLLLILLMLFGHPSWPSSALRATEGSGLITALAAGLFAFGGWHMVTYAAGETRDPARTIPRSLMIGVAIVVATYMALSAAYLFVLPIDRVLSSTRIAADAASAVAGSKAEVAVSLLVVVSALGSMNGIILAGPRVYYAMARDRLAFDWMGAVHPRFKSPHAAIAAQAVWSSVLVLTGSYRALFTRVVYTEWIFFGALAIGALRLRRRGGYAPAFRAWGFPFAPLAFAGICGLIVVDSVRNDPAGSAIGLSIVVAGLPVYYLSKRQRRLE
jgi:APA family basic amino acid/polyamine antiporter